MSGDAVPALSAVVPHRGAMLLLDEVVSGDDHGIVCRVTPRADGTFAADGGVAAVVAVEYMAQACAAWLGWQALRRGEPPAGGWLVGLRDVELACDRFAFGTPLEVHARHGFGEQRLASFETRVVAGTRLLASATLNVLRHGG